MFFCGSSELLCDVLRIDRSLDQKIKFLRENNFLQWVSFYLHSILCCHLFVDNKCVVMKWLILLLFLPVTSLYPVKAPAGDWWQLSDCCHCHSHYSKATHTPTFICMQKKASPALKSVYILWLYLCSVFGLTWIIIRLLCTFFSHHWKAVLLGKVVCEEREEWSLQTAKTLCQRLLQDTYTALHKVCL